MVWVVFYFGGVILTTGNRDEYDEAMIRAVKLVSHPSIASPNDLKKRVYDGPEFQLAKTGKMSSDELYQSIFGQYGITDMPQIMQCRDAVRSCGRHVHPKLIEFVHSLKSRAGLRVAVLSNFESDLRFMIQKHGIEGLFPEDAVMSSYDLGFAKPSLECFAAARQQLEQLTQELASAEEAIIEKRAEHNTAPDFTVIFIDDKEKNIAAASVAFHQYGVVYKSVDQCIADVEAALALALA
jgi:phosphoglycolate phosphatase-like HAD superfamily hydrolase